MRGADGIECSHGWVIGHNVARLTDDATVQILNCHIVDWTHTLIYSGHSIAGTQRLSIRRKGKIEQRCPDVKVALVLRIDTKGCRKLNQDETRKCLLEQ